MSCNFGKGSHLHLIDGSSFIFRAFHALPPLTRPSDKLPVGAVAGFVNMIWRYIEDNKGPDAPTHAAVIFDAAGPTFRDEIYDLYKANREEMPEDLRPQIPLTREATRAFNLACIEKEGYEADDIIATLTRMARDKGGEVTIISSDKDLMQLVGEGVEMLDAMKDRRIGPKEVEERFGVPPEKVVDVLALAGDSVDNIPGAPGIGVKTAALLINEYGDIDNLLAHAEEIKQPKRRQTLIEYADQIRLSRELVKLDDHVPLDVSLCDLEVKRPDPEVLLDFLKKMEFRTITRRVAEALGVEPPEIETKTAAERGPEAPEMPPFSEAVYEAVTDRQALEQWIARITERGWVAIDTETTSLDEMQADLVGISLCIEPGHAAYVPLAHRPDSSGDLFGSEALAEGQMGMEEALEMLKPVLEDEAILKIGQNVKYDAKVLARLGIDMAPIDDTMLLSYAMYAGLHGHGMDTLSELYLGHKPVAIKELIGSGKAQIRFDQVPVEKAVRYAAEDADVTLRLWELFKPQLHRERATTIYETEERPLVPVLARMEMAGIKVDRDALSRLSAMFAQKMAALEAEIHELAGEKFNVASPSQLGEILFGKMGLPGGKRTKTGHWSTSAQVLEDLATENPLAAKVLDWRQLAKLKSTYTDALQAHIDPETGRVHTSYAIAGANTGRLASTDPNLQNIPVRTEEGRRIREAFVAEEGRLLVSLDYSQIELRIFAHMADIDALKHAFAEGLDIHSMSAAAIFEIPIEEVTPEIRRRAKAVNYGIIYGLSAFGLARNLRIPRAEAQEFIDAYLKRFPGIRAYQQEIIERARKQGYVQTLFGRRIHTPEIESGGAQASAARRAAMNAPIQGTAADIIRRAMVHMERGVGDLPAQMLLQVHDELVFEVDEEAADELISRARAVMEHAPEPAVKLSVPLEVDAGKGRNWAEAH
ncbi:MAG: DNA polymerase I [Alphaproteobacteria bacterium]|nr:MAG: DNA polymerase I [Alphaproteobacteria bacterium]